MRRINFFLVAAVASVGIFLSTQAFARGTKDQTEYYRYQSSQSQVGTTGQQSDFNSSSDQFSNRGVVTDRTQVQNPAYYDQNFPAQGDRYYYENREFRSSGPNSSSQPYYDNQRYGTYDNQQYGTTNRYDERYQGQYNYSGPETGTPGYYGNRPGNAYDRFGNTYDNRRMDENRPDLFGYTHPFYYQGAGDTWGGTKFPAGRNNPHGPLQSIPE